MPLRPTSSTAGVLMELLIRYACRSSSHPSRRTCPEEACGRTRCALTPPRHDRSRPVACLDAHRSLEKRLSSMGACT
jgi:hypothetical protein